MFARRVLITAGTPGHMYLDDRQAKWLQERHRHVRKRGNQPTTCTRIVLDGHVRHGLVDGLHPVAHGELVYDLLRRLLEVNLPGIVPFGIRDLHHAVVLDVCHIVEEVLLEGKNKKETEKKKRKRLWER